MVTIYRKTDKGRAEIDTRAHRLPPRLRNALILVDGQRSDADLAKMILQQAAETLESLLAQGFIEANPTAAPVAVPRSAPTAAPAAAGASAAPAPPMKFEHLRRDAVRALTDAVGPSAEMVALRMEKARDLDTLRPELELARQLIHNTRGSAAAAAFAVRFIG